MSISHTIRLRQFWTGVSAMIKTSRWQLHFGVLSRLQMYGDWWQHAELRPRLCRGIGQYSHLQDYSSHLPCAFPLPLCSAKHKNTDESEKLIQGNQFALKYSKQVFWCFQDSWSHTIIDCDLELNRPALAGVEILPLKRLVTHPSKKQSSVPIYELAVTTKSRVWPQKHPFRQQSHDNQEAHMTDDCCKETTSTVHQQQLAPQDPTSVRWFMG